MAGLADLFVNDAFSCSHRAHASVCKITEFLPSFAGLQLETIKSESAGNNLFEGKTFVVSGVFTEFSRDGIKENIKQHGGKVVSSISSKLNYLVAGDKMGPSKRKKAEDLGTTIISESEYIQLIEQA